MNIGIKLHSLEDLGTLLRHRRKALGYTQAEVAEFNRCSLRFISELERGLVGGNFKTVLLVANSLGVDLIAQERGDV